MIVPLWARLAAVAVLAAAVWGHGFLQGAARVEARWDAQRAADERAYLAGVVRAGKVADRVVYQYIDRWRTVVQQGEVIIREVPTYVTVEADRRCVIPRGFVQLHDAAATGQPLPAAAGDPDEPAAGLALSAVGATVAGNYGVCRQIRAQLSALQAWAAEVSAPGPP